MDLKKRTQYLLLALLAAAPLCGCRTATPIHAFHVPAAGETAPVANAGDAADDPAVWVHPTDPDQSRIIGTNKKGGLGVYDLAGRELQFLPLGRVNNVDLRQRVATEDNSLIDIAAASHRERRGITLCAISTSGELRELEGSPSAVSVEEPYGLCCWTDRRTGAFYVFVNDKNGRVEQWRVRLSSTKVLSHSLERSWKLSSQVEGMVADDALGMLFVGEEAVGVWAIDLTDPASSPTPVTSANPSGPLVADVEGLALAHSRHGPLLLVSSQGSNSFAVYNARPPFKARGSFQIGTGTPLSVEETDGIEVCQSLKTRRFPNGILVAQDGLNDPHGQNFKIVDWTAIEAGLTR